MSNLKVCKFGGTSMATADSIKAIKKVIDSEESRRYVVVSAPGKRFSGDAKITDMLYDCFAKKDDARAFDTVFAKIKARYDEIIKGLGADIDFADEYEHIAETIKSSKTADYAASRGEYLGAKLVAAYFGWQFVDAAELVKFNDDGSFNDEKTNDATRSTLSQYDRAVIPGFYGADFDGDIVVFSRGGSDISGAIVARAVRADVYENWTDVNGFLMVDPRIVKDPKHIKALSYRELRELSYMGANVLHSESIFPVRREGIPINIRNTFEPEHEGTMILPEPPENHGTITGIAGKKGFTTITVEKSMMNNEVGFVRRILSIIEHYGICFEHIPSGIDTFCIVISNSELEGKLDGILDEIARVVKPDHIETHSGIALIATVGHGMAYKIGTSARLFKALSDAGVNVRMIDQGSSELNIIVGVGESDYEKAIKAIYDEFVNE